MKAKDLRIGNLVLGASRGKEHEVNIDILKLLSEKGIGYNPIPITKQWLLKLGFKENEGYWYDINISEYDVLSYSLLSGISLLGYKNEWGLTEIKIKYVHQLQNLFFALTGKELKLKED